MWHLLLADAIVVVHFAFVAFIVLGLFYIWLGAALKWSSVRNRTFRFIHLGAMLFVLLETVLGFICPLTEWESALRQAAGQSGYGQSFMQYWIHRIMYYDLPNEFFVILYSLFFLAMILTYLLIRPVKCSTSIEDSE